MGTAPDGGKCLVNALEKWDINKVISFPPICPLRFNFNFTEMLRADEIGREGKKRGIPVRSNPIGGAKQEKTRENEKTPFGAHQKKIGSEQANCGHVSEKNLLVKVTIYSSRSWKLKSKTQSRNVRRSFLPAIEIYYEIERSYSSAK